MKQNGRTISCLACGVLFLIQHGLGDALAGHAGAAADRLCLQALSCKKAVLWYTFFVVLSVADW